MGHYSIAVVPGDGIGPEVCDATLQVLNVVASETLSFSFSSHPAGATCYLETGEAFPAATLEACRAADAILHGASGLPDVCYPDGTEAGQDFCLKLRPALDLYANIRPIKLYTGVRSPLADQEPGSIDYIIVREGSEGLYASRGGGLLLREEVASDTLLVTRRGVERVVRVAAEMARRRNGAPSDGVSRVTVVDKANVLRSFAFFRRIADATLAQYPDIEVEHLLSDAMSLHMVERPHSFDVVVTENFLGDLLSDLGAATVGGLGMSPSGEIGDHHALFQASHGSAPTIAGKNLANPLATILSAALMLEWLGTTRNDAEATAAAKRITRAVELALETPAERTRDIGGTASTTECTAAVCGHLGQMSSSQPAVAAGV